jgi:biopolymer transport protein ExbB/TolQ
MEEFYNEMQQFKEFYGIVKFLMSVPSWVYWILLGIQVAMIGEFFNSIIDRVKSQVKQEWEDYEEEQAEKAERKQDNVSEYKELQRKLDDAVKRERELKNEKDNIKSNSLNSLKESDPTKYQPKF